MNPTLRTALRGLLALAVLWGIVALAVRIAGSSRATPEKIVSFAEAHPLGEIEDEEERRRVISRVADMLNQLEPAELGELAERAGADPRAGFFEEMNPGEQLYFMERRMGRAFEQIMQSFNEMERGERRALVERSLSQMRDNPGAPGARRLEEADPDLAERIAEAGLKAYYSQASAETKLDLAPLMEEMQRSLTRLGGGRHR